MSFQQLLSVQMPEENKAGQDLEHGCHRDTQADAEERAEDAAHEECHGDAHQKGRRAPNRFRSAVLPPWFYPQVIELKEYNGQTSLEKL